jgi:Polyketide cyclase / dehydrase and lipid transport
VSSVRHAYEGIILLHIEQEIYMSILSYLGYGAGVVAVLAAGTMLLPRNVVVQRSGSVAAAPSAILALAASNEGYQKFNPYLKADPAMKLEMFGPASGVGSGFKFDSKDGKGSAVVTKVTADSVDYALDLGSNGKPNQTISVVPDGTGSKVTWTMNADMGNNPIGRVIGLFLDGMIGPNFDSGLKLMNETVK